LSRRQLLQTTKKPGKGSKNSSSDGGEGEEEDEEAFNPYESMILLRVFACKPGYCLANNTCVNGSTSVLCSGCLENHAMSAGSCDSCESDVDMDQMRTIVAIGVAIGAFIGWLLVCALALVPQLQVFIGKIRNMFAPSESEEEDGHGETAGMLSECMEATTECAATVKEVVEDCLPAELFEGDAATAMFKIVISFYQVVSSFLNFNVSPHTSLHTFTFCFGVP